MHAGEVDIDVELVVSLISAQFPEYAGLPVHRLHSAGTDNAMFRLGTKLAVRLPKVASAESQVHREQRWLPVLAPDLPLPIPTPVGFGLPSEGFTMHWSIYRWLDGNNAFDEAIDDVQHAAAELGRFGAALRRLDPTNGPPSFRGSPLGDQESAVLAAITDLAADGILDEDAAQHAWQTIVRISQWSEPAVWTHSDLLPSNLLVKDGRLAAVIDFGQVGVGDPACDMMVAWTVFGANERKIFREHAEVDDATWDRGRGWAFGFGLMAYHYHRLTNPVLAAIGRRSLSESLVELTS